MKKQNVNNTSISFVDSEGVEVTETKLYNALGKENDWHNKVRGWVKAAIADTAGNGKLLLESVALKCALAGGSQDARFKSLRTQIQTATKAAGKPQTLKLVKDGKGKAAKTVGAQIGPIGTSRGANANKAKATSKAKAAPKSTSTVDKKLQTLFNEFNKVINEATAEKLIERIQELVADAEAKKADKK